MKSPLVLSLILASAPTFAAPKAKPATLEQLKKEAAALAATLENAQGCELKVEETREGITISIRDKKSTAFLDVSSDNQIQLEVEAMERDGSSAMTFHVKGQGALRLVHADDAFDSAELTDRDGRVLSCELDL